MVNLLSIIFLSVIITSKSISTQEIEVSSTITRGKSEIAIFKTLRNSKIEQNPRRRTYQSETQHIYVYRINTETSSI